MARRPPPALEQIFERKDLAPSVRWWSLPRPDRKGIAIRLFFHQPLDEGTTARALIASVLTRGSRRYPTQKKLIQRLDTLYGAGFGVSVLKLGERHLLAVALDLPGGRFTPEGRGLLDAGLGLAREVLGKPLVRKDGFVQRYVAQESENLANAIRSIIDDRSEYALLRALAAACADEPYRRHELGCLEDLPHLTPASLLERFVSLRQSSPVDVFTTGPYAPATMERALGGLLAGGLVRSGKSGGADGLRTTLRPPPPGPRRVQETLSVEQARLVMVYRTGVTSADSRIHPLHIANGLFGGMPHSFLFRDVREKAGLAYAVSSSLETVKGLLVVEAGVLAKDAERTVEMVEAAREAIAAGRFDPADLEKTRRTLEEGVLALVDHPARWIHLALEQSLFGPPSSLGDLLADLRRVTADQVREVASGIGLDTVYLLSGADEDKTLSC